MIGSASGLSYESPRLPTDDAMPTSASRSVRRIEKYRENLGVARCRVRRLMREMGLTATARGRAWTTTQSQPSLT
jgi:transposase InsO family protein